MAHLKMTKGLPVATIVCLVFGAPSQPNWCEMPLIVWVNAGARRTLHRLLQLDKPVPSRSDDEIAAEVERNYRWNFSVNLIEGASFMFGISLISSSTIVPLFISKLTSNPLAIGLASMVALAGWFLPQLFTANAVEQLPRRKPVVVNAGFFLERLPVLLFPGIALIAGRSAGLALVLFLACYAWFHVGAGLVGTSWQDMVARCFPVKRRGRFFGLTTFAGTASGAIGAIFSSWLLKTYPFPTNFFDVTAELTGYISQTVNTIPVVEGITTVQDFHLEPITKSAATIAFMEEYCNPGLVSRMT